MGAAHPRGPFYLFVAHAFFVFHQDGVALALGQAVDELSCQSVAVVRIVLNLSQHETFCVDRHRGLLLSELIDAAALDDGQTESFHVLALYRRPLFPQCDDGFLDGIFGAVRVAEDALGGPLQAGLQA